MGKMNKKLTLAIAKEAELPQKGDYIIRDTTTSGLGLRVYASGVKTWIFQKKFNDKPLRMVLGPALSFPLESKYDPKTGERFKGARELAENAAAQIRQGLDPRLEKSIKITQSVKSHKQTQLTVKRSWDEYCKFKGNLPSQISPSPRTLKDYTNVEKKLSQSPIWNMPLISLSASDLMDEITRLTRSAKAKTAVNKGMTQASITIRYLRAAFNYSVLKHKLNTQNPFLELNKLFPKWNATNARNRRLGENEGALAEWWKAVSNLRLSPNRDASTIADFLQLSILFGTRKTELLSLKWEDVDLSNNVIILHWSKTKAKRQHIIPITDHVREILIRRQNECQKLHQLIKSKNLSIDESWVFPSSRKGRVTKIYGPITSVNKTIQKVIKETGVPFSPHDLRRTFGTLLNEQGETSFTIEKALNHAPSTVAAKSYINNPRLSNLRKIFQQLEDTILIEAGVLNVKQKTIEITIEEYERLKAKVII